MVTIRALKTTSGEYGKLKRGQTASVRPSVANTLAKKGTVEIVTEDDGLEPEPQVKEYSITIKEGGNKIFDSNDDRKIIRKDTVITPEGPEVPQPEGVVVGMDFADGPSETVVAVIENGKVTEVVSSEVPTQDKEDGKDSAQTETGEQKVEEPAKEDPAPAEGKTEQTHDSKATQKETAKKQYHRK